jgi:transposase InsO family protein
VILFRFIDAEKARFPGVYVVQDRWCLKERLLRFEEQTALQEARRRRAHREDPRGPSEKQGNLRVPEGARRATRSGSTLRPQAGRSSDAKSRTARVHAWPQEEEEDHPPRSLRRSGSRPRKKLPCHRTGQTWTADIIYLRTEEGFLYLAFVLDFTPEGSWAGLWLLTSERSSWSTS